MKLADLLPFTIDAIARTHGAVEDRDELAPTWDGKVLHIARIQQEDHVLHEVAHWVVAEPEERRTPNYGLGKDPDGGPETPSTFVGGYGSWKEEEASLVTTVLECAAGLPWGHGAKGQLPWMRGERESLFWLMVGDLRDRGIIANDPLRGFPPKRRRRSA